MPSRRVMLIVETSTAFGRGVLAGVGAYAANHGRWSLYVTERGLADGCPRWLRWWRGDGIIFRGSTPRMVSLIRGIGLPAVDTCCVGGEHGLPVVYSDEDEIAALAAEHFLQRGFRHFGFCATVRGSWAQRRRAAFEHHWQARPRGDCSTLAVCDACSGGWDRQRHCLEAWLRSLPKPAAVLASSDLCGTRTIDACLAAGISVPEEVAVLGIGNDELLCRLAAPPLSSVDTDAPRVGYEAAALLERLMDGGTPPAQPCWVPAGGVVARQSTDVTAIDDKELARALCFIRRHACRGIGVDDVLQAVTVSRATLERRFAVRLGRSPRSEILRVRLEEVRRLLHTTDYSLERIAELTAFKTSSHLSVAFKRETGQTPSDYRQKRKVKNASGRIWQEMPGRVAAGAAEAP